MFNVHWNILLCGLYDTGPKMRCSFEETMDILLDAAVYAESDYLRRVTENIMLGQLAPIGTGDCSLYLNDEMLKNAIELQLPSYMEGLDFGMTPAHAQFSPYVGGMAFSPTSSPGYSPSSPGYSPSSPGYSPMYLARAKGTPRRKGSLEPEAKGARVPPYTSGRNPADYSPSSPQYSPSAGYSPSAPGYSPSSTSQYTPQKNMDDKSTKDDKGTKDTKALYKARHCSLTRVVMLRLQSNIGERLSETLLKMPCMAPEFFKSELTFLDQLTSIILILNSCRPLRKIQIFVQCKTVLMEKPTKIKAMILAFLPKAATPFTFQLSPPWSPRGISASARKGFPGPVIRIIPDEVRGQPKTDSFIAREPTSPKISCIGGVKNKKRKNIISKSKIVLPPVREAKHNKRCEEEATIDDEHF
ncbi:hypothetical protein EZV62_014438 [Acer yangbiense]|uniref:DNA-directed RNA polymerase n=1 Tax=Acer yangbiense TaxID=1000413 RepID=A0A5C7HSU7_9ROSI|nr:hypothetical protein EZV62_014438 [Acer yangbiense]